MESSQYSAVLQSQLLLELIVVLNNFSLKIIGTEKKAVTTLHVAKPALNKLKVTVMETERLLQAIFLDLCNPSLDEWGSLLAALKVTC